MNYSINKLSPLIVLGAKRSIVVEGGEGSREEGGREEGEERRGGGWRRMQGFIVSVTLNDTAATLRVMKTTSKVI